MLTQGDDFPIHQTADPIAYSGTDRNFYDRYWFNGYSRDGRIFFACAFGIYPHLNIMDGAFCVVIDGIQHNIHVSRHLGMERMNTVVGPLSIEVIEPLNRLRLKLADNEYGIKADIVFRGRAPAVMEPRYHRRIGPRMFMDFTRFTQSGVYDGWIQVDGNLLELNAATVWGTRDRSWGVRPIGQMDPQELAPPVVPQLYWLWAPLNFDDCFTLYNLNADQYGRPWNTAAALGKVGTDQIESFHDCHSEVVMEKGSRHAKSATLKFKHGDGAVTRIELLPQWKFYMSGLGYMHPEWGHGLNKGASANGYERIDLKNVHSFLPPYTHIQHFVLAKMTLPDGTVKHGSGAFEQCLIGPYEPLGLKELFDPAP